MMKQSRVRLAILVVAIALIQVLTPRSLYGDEVERSKYPFVQLKVENQPERNMCLGIAGAIASLEEATEENRDGEVEELVNRIWKTLYTHEDNLAYPRFILLGDGTRVKTRSIASIKSIALLLQLKYEKMIQDQVWQSRVVVNPSTDAGQSVLKARSKYEVRYKDKVTSSLQLKELIDSDKDRLVPLAGRGVREFRNGPPQRVIAKFDLRIDEQTQRYPPSPSLHAFLITYDKNAGSFYVYDSDDPKQRWLANARGEGDDFLLDWHIDDHMGNGPSTQMYFDVKPLSELLDYFRRIVEGQNAEPTNAATTK